MPVDDEELQFVGFNQDATSLAVGSRKRYRLFSLSNAEELTKLHERDLPDVCLIERLFSSSLVTLVSHTAPRKLRVFHFQKDTEICNHSYSNTVLNVKLNRLRLIVCLEESLYVHNIRDMKVLHTIRDTPANPSGLCDLCATDKSYLAYPGSSRTGELQIFDAANLQALAMIEAHDSPIAAIKFNSDGGKVATASEKGTVIRVFSVPEGEKLFEFRRGVKRCAAIYSLNFSPDSMYLCSSSNTETVHIFKLDIGAGPSPVVQQGGSGWMDYVSRTATPYLPSQVSEILSQDRAFATARLIHPGSKNCCALAVINKVLRLLVASVDGYMYVYNCENPQGGELSLFRQYCLLGEPDKVGSDVLDRSAGNSDEAANTSDGGGTSEKDSATSYASKVDVGKQVVAETTRSDLSVEVDRLKSNTDELKLDDESEFPPMNHVPE